MMDTTTTAFATPNSSCATIVLATAIGNRNGARKQPPGCRGLPLEETHPAQQQLNRLEQRARDLSNRASRLRSQLKKEQKRADRARTIARSVARDLSDFSQSAREMHARQHNQDMHTINGNPQTSSRQKKQQKKPGTAGSPVAQSPSVTPHDAAKKEKLSKITPSAHKAAECELHTQHAAAMTPAGKRAEKVAKAQMKKATALVDQLADEAAKKQAEEDVLREKEKEEEAERLREQERLVDAFFEAKTTQLRDRLQKLHLHGVYTGPSAPSSSYLPQSVLDQFGVEALPLLTVRPSVTSGTQIHPIVPHTYCYFDFLDVSRVEATKRLPAHMKYQLDDGRFHLMHLNLCLVDFGFLSKEVAKRPPELVSISVESLLNMHHRQYSHGRTSLMDLMDQVAGFLAQDYPTEKGYYDFSVSGRLVVYAYASILWALMGPDTTGALDISDGMLKAAIFKTLCKDRPLAAGTYIKGYDVSIRDVFPDEPVQFTDKMCAYVSGRAQCARESWRAVYANIHIKELVAAFPDRSPNNLFLGFARRLGIARGYMHPEYRHHLQAMTDAIIQHFRIQPAVLDVEAARRSCEAHCRGFNDDAKAYYMLGAERALSGDLLSDPEILTFNGCFVKQEAYPGDKFKTPRFIICPDLYVRGYTHALLYEVQHSFFQAMEAHSVKGLDQQQVEEKLSESFTGREYWLETDYTSFESNVTADQMRCTEFPVIVKGSPPQRQAQVKQLYETLMSCQHRCVNKLFTLGLSPMRLSGQDQTSYGNYIVNLSNSLTIVWRSLFPNLSADAFLQMDKPFFFEGDDGAIHIGSELPKELFEEVLSQSGLRLKFEVHRRPEEMGFLSRTYEVIPGQGGLKVRNLPSPLPMLSKMFTIFDPTDTSKHRDAVAAAKAHSYAEAFGHVPILGPIAQALKERYSEFREEVLKHISEMPDGTIQAIDERGRQILSSLPYFQKTNLTHWFQSLKVPKLPSLSSLSPVATQLRAAVERRFGISVVDQHLVEDSIIQQIREGKNLLSCPALSRLTDKLVAARAMTTRCFDDARESASKQYQQLRATHHLKQLSATVTSCFNDYRQVITAFVKMMTTPAGPLVGLGAFFFFPGLTAMVLYAVAAFHVLFVAALTLIQWPFTRLVDAVKRSTALLVFVDAALVLWVLEVNRQLYHRTAGRWLIDPMISFFHLFGCHEAADHLGDEARAAEDLRARMDAAAAPKPDPHVTSPTPMQMEDDEDDEDEDVEAAPGLVAPQQGFAQLIAPP